MQGIIITIIVILIATIIWLIYADFADYTNLTVIQDLTVSRDVPIDIVDVQNQFRFDNHLNQGARFRYVGMDSHELGKIRESLLESSSGLSFTNMSPDFQMQFENISEFLKDVRQILLNAKEIVIPTPEHCGASCYLFIVSELHRCAKGVAWRKVLIIDAPLYERSDAFDNTTDEGLKMLIEDPWCVARILNEARWFPYLGRFHIHFVYQPKNEREAQIYYGMIEVYKLLFGCQDAEISIVNPAKANLI